MTNGTYEGLGAILGALSILLSPDGIIRALKHFGNRRLPNELLDLGSLSEAFRRGLVNGDFFDKEMLDDGISAEKSAILQTLTQQLIDSGSLMTLLLRGTIDQGEFYKRTQALGLPNNSADLLFSLTQQRLNANDVLEAWLRGYFTIGSAGDLFKDLSDQGWSAERLSVLQKLAFRLAAIGDLFQFGAWRVDDDSFASIAGLDKDMPTGYFDEAAKIGIDQSLARRLWRSHWQPPSPFILKELYQTGQIPDTVLDSLLGAYQIPPNYRPYIIKGFSKFLTSAEITTALAHGDITDAEVPAMVANLGYPQDQAKLLINQIIRKAHDPAQAAKNQKATDAATYGGMTKSLVYTAFEDSLIDETTARTYLTALGEASDVQDLNFEVIAYKQSATAVKQDISYVEDEYLTGAIDDNGVVSALNQLGLDTLKVNHYLTTWKRKITKTNKLPSKAELDKFVKAQIIDLPTYQAQLTLLGYNDTYISWFVADLSVPSSSKSNAQTPSTSS